MRTTITGKENFIVVNISTQLKDTEGQKGGGGGYVYRHLGHLTKQRTLILPLRWHLLNNEARHRVVSSENIKGL